MTSRQLALMTTLLVACGIAGFLLLRSHSADPNPPAPRTAGPLHAPPPIRPEPSAVPELDADAFVQQLIVDLQNPDTRTLARVRLAALPDALRDALPVVPDSRLDPEIQALLTARLDEINARLLLQPAPVTLHVTSATFNEIVPLFNAQMQGRLASNVFEEKAVHYTLDADARPFWEIIRALNDQSPLLLQRSGSLEFGGLSLGNLATRVNYMEKTDIRGPFFLFARWVPRTTGTTAPLNERRIELSVAADPRLKLLASEMIVAAPITDNLGHPLLPATDFETPERRSQSANLLFTKYLTLLVPPDVGTALPSIKIKARMVLALASREAELDDVATKVGQPIELGTTTAMVTSFSSDAKTHISVAATSTAGTPYVIYDLFDKDNILLRRWAGEIVLGSGLPNFSGGPFHLHLTAPQKTVEVTTEFELTNWPLPQNP